MSNKLPAFRTAFAHDWLTGMRGGERVLELCCREYPDALIHTLLCNPGSISDTINAHSIRTSFLQHIPGIENKYRLFLPLMPLAAASLHPADADLLISFSHCVAKGVRPPGGAKHLCYCFTPMRYAWIFYEEYFGRNPLKRMMLAPLLAYLRRWDRRTARRVDRFVAISEHVRKRIASCYGREADVVYPPVDVDFFSPEPGTPREEYDLVVSALVPYKKVDLAVRAYTHSGYPLKIVGVGTEYDHLQAEAGSNVEFTGRLSDEEIRGHYRTCRQLIFPGEEDFGLVPVEAQACGCPVIAYGKGGALETIEDGVSGIFFNEQTEEALLEAAERGSTADWDAEAIRKNAEKFGIPRFFTGLSESIRVCMEG